MSDYEYQKAPEKTVFIKKGEGKKFKGSKECFTGDVEVELLTDAN